MTASMPACFQSNSSGVKPYPLSVAVGSLRAMGGPPQGSPVVVKISRRIHLML